MTKFRGNTPCNVRTQAPSPHTLPASRGEGAWLGTLRPASPGLRVFRGAWRFCVASFLYWVSQAAPRRVSETAPRSRQTGDETITRLNVRTSSRRRGLRHLGTRSRWTCRGDRLRLHAARIRAHCHKFGPRNDPEAAWRLGVQSAWLGWRAPPVPHWPGIAASLRASQ